MQPNEKKDMLIFSLIFIGLLVIAGVFMFRNSLKSANETPGLSGTTNPENAQELNNPNNPSQANTPPQENTGDLPETNVKTYTSAPQMVLEEGKDYQATIKTNKGNIKVDLFEKETPITVNNFVFLSKENFYNNVKFHRIIKDFMIQGGDPLGTGSGGPGYTFDDEPFEGEYTPGTLAMANSGPNTNGSQFFIMHGNVSLPKDYVIFGRVADESGMAVVNTIANIPTVSNGFDSQPSKPTEDIIIESIEITEL